MDPTAKIDWQSAIGCLHALATKGLVRQGMTTDGTTRWHLTGRGETLSDEEDGVMDPFHDMSRDVEQAREHKHDWQAVRIALDGQPYRCADVLWVCYCGVHQWRASKEVA